MILVAGRAMDAFGRRSFARHGLTISDLAPLTVLDRVGPMTPKQLQASSPLLNSPQVVSHSVNRLVDAGLATRTPNPDDRRSVIIEATDRGRAISDELLAEIEEHSTEFLAPLDRDEIIQLRDLLAKCLEPSKAHPIT